MLRVGLGIRESFVECFSSFGTRQTSCFRSDACIQLNGEWPLLYKLPPCRILPTRKMDIHPLSVSTDCLKSDTNVNLILALQHNTPRAIQYRAIIPSGTKWRYLVPGHSVLNAPGPLGIQFRAMTPPGTKWWHLILGGVMACTKWSSRGYFKMIAYPMQSQSDAQVGWQRRLHVRLEIAVLKPTDHACAFTHEKFA